MRDPVRWIVGAILLLALTLRLAFVLALPDRPFYWDERHYAGWAAAYQEGWSALLGSGGEATLLEAFRASVQKGELYSALVGLLYAVVGPRPRAVFLLQALLDTLTCWLLFGLARAAAGVRAGLIALAVAALYEPFIFAAARLQTETLAVTLYVAALWALCVPQRRRAAGAFFAGVALAAAMLCRPALKYLFPLLLPAVLLRNWDRPQRNRAVLAMLFAAGFLVVVGPRALLTKVVTGEATLSGSLDPGVDMYAGAVLGNIGWKTNRLAFATPPRDELLAVLGNDPGRRLRQDDFRAATIRTWVVHPLASSAVVLHKLYVAWLYPYNDSRWTLLTGATGTALFHRIILAFALVGMPLSLRRWRVAVPLFVAMLSFWMTYVMMKIEVRYAVMAMPMMICFAAVAAAVLSRGWQLVWPTDRRRRLVVLAASAAVGLIAARAFTIGRLLDALPVAPDAAHGVRVGVIIAVIAVLTCLAAELAPLPRRAVALALLAPSAVVAALVVLVGRPLAQTWHEWQSTLTANRGVASQEFIVPAVEPPLSAQLRLDLLPARDGDYDLVVRVDGEEVKRYRGGLKRSDANLPADGPFARLVAAQRRTLEPDRAWYSVPIPAEKIAPGQRIAVEIALEGRGRSGAVALLGDYQPDAAAYVGPSLLSPAMTADTSLYRYLTEGDFRMSRQFRLAGSSRSRFFDGITWTSDDLAFDSGRQQGRYRIFLLLVYPDGVVIL